ncbi:hypothetical protein AUEXF2481DRAFT_26061 [Aureobasidium subglaciale EXF-2481]|uniref:Uncharacterized protein n=1 Tax=Aureobasidium subglaciale (strain EXF-2481) TaxID=1043005 RepID=A0A074ZJZ7_AURSE|nr:uncharacterized protein AUEXF2481DRAFT_26061 [Aureobasidium subglaciale EXF-2481]KAI5203826.1 hypothetical protein E4T38_04960 [Aureobasidium subglaciale]KAI5222223.1 hypothetical protein E4T40_04998 [Aureobasidium subglaciale]KAI5226284.1 hypothetical protein E4T41_04817 [Aureobasidium subglaciale]KAI5262066.1 hypothetical protein E4T46_04710 [Aureobasidium subglaciale]KEQ98811.1 hypothetical protein AUEXF2481DRAFT_26061 [Aureobasidium subglaciale EXF-2481]
MSSQEIPNDIILFHYTFSPFAKRIVWYLKLRGIPYAECIQPLTLPRPDLAELGINYRRIPLLSIGRDVYYDTRLILARLEQSFPASSYPPLSMPNNKGLEALLEKFTVDAGIFSKAAQSLPPDLPVMKDEKFLKDRADFTGTSWSQADRVKGYPEALAHIRHAFDILEALLADGRQWIGGTDKVSLADIHAVWPFNWIGDMLPKQAFPKDQHPKTWAWLSRFKKTVKEVEASSKKTVSLDGQAAIQHIMSASYHDQQTGVDSNDPVKLNEGDLVQLWPTDSGFRHKDQGHLVKLTNDEVVLAIQTKTGGKEIRVHAPRWGFRVVKAKAQL